RLVALRLGDLLLAREPRQLLPDETAAALGDVAAHVHERDGEAARRRELRDAAPHLPRPDDADVLDAHDGAGHSTDCSAASVLRPVGQSSSTASAMPSPPPMHNEATPRFAFPLPASRSAESSVTSTRAPEAPMG